MLYFMLINEVKPTKVEVFHIEIKAHESGLFCLGILPQVILPVWKCF